MKYSKEIADKFIGLYATGNNSIQDICAVLKIHRDTFYEWKKKNKAFAKNLEEAEKKRLDAIREMALSGMVLLLAKHEYDETTIDYVEGKDGKPKIKSQKTVKKFIMPNPSMVALALINRDPDHWKNRQTAEITGKDGAQIVVKIE